MSLTMSLGAQGKGKKYDWNKVMNAVIQVESEGNPKAYNPNGNCAGILQITPIVVKQCNIWLEKEKSKKRYTLNDRYNVTKSKEMFIMIQEHYNPSNNIEKAIRIWNEGPSYNKKVKTTNYLKRVLKELEKK